MPHPCAVPTEGLSVHEHKLTVGVGVFKRVEMFGGEGERFGGQEPPPGVLDACGLVVAQAGVAPGLRQLFRREVGHALWMPQ